MYHYQIKIQTPLPDSNLGTITRLKFRYNYQLHIKYHYQLHI